MIAARDDFKVDREAMYTMVTGDAEYCVPTAAPPSRSLSTLTLFGTREGAEAPAACRATAAGPICIRSRLTVGSAVVRPFTRRRRCLTGQMEVAMEDIVSGSCSWRGCLMAGGDGAAAYALAARIGSGLRRTRGRPASRRPEERSGEGTRCFSGGS
jgi:hypothetical protein